MKRLLKKGTKYLTSSDYRFLINVSLGLHNRMEDAKFLKRSYKANMKRELSLEKPVTFNEKLQWLKLYDRRPAYTVMADKYLVRDYIAEKLGPEYAEEATTLLWRLAECVDECLTERGW